MGPEGGGEAYRQACQEVRDAGRLRRSRWSIRQGFLLDIALNHLSLGRALLGLAWPASDLPRDLDPTTEALDRAVNGLREASAEDFIARGLLARAALRRLA